MTTAREQVHFHACPDIGTCEFVGGPGNRRQCGELTDLLNLVEEQRMHEAAEDLRKVANNPDMAGSSESQEYRTGWMMAAYLLDPYLKIDAFVPGSGASDPRLIHPDCTQCDAGREHWHRKTDGKRVAVPTLGYPAFRGGLKEIR